MRNIKDSNILIDINLLFDKSVGCLKFLKSFNSNIYILKKIRGLLKDFKDNKLVELSINRPTANPLSSIIELDDSMSIKDLDDLYNSLYKKCVKYIYEKSVITDFSYIFILYLKSRMSGLNLNILVYDDLDLDLISNIKELKNVNIIYKKDLTLEKMNCMDSMYIYDINILIDIYKDINSIHGKVIQFPDCRYVINDSILKDDDFETKYDEFLNSNNLISFSLWRSERFK